MAVPFMQCDALLQRGSDVSSGRIPCNSQQAIRHFGHRAHYHHRLSFRPAAHDTRNPVDGDCVLNRGSPEFHDDHDCTSSNDCIAETKNPPLSSGGGSWANLAGSSQVPPAADRMPVGIPVPVAVSVELDATNLEPITIDE